MTVKSWLEAESGRYAKAFEVWETEFRAHPEDFMTAEEMAATEVLPLSQARAVYFNAILKRLA